MKRSFVGYVTAYMFTGIPKESIEVTHKVFWYVHMVISFGLPLATSFTPGCFTSIPFVEYDVPGVVKMFPRGHGAR